MFLVLQLDVLDFIFSIAVLQQKYFIIQTSKIYHLMLLGVCHKQHFLHTPTKIKFVAFNLVIVEDNSDNHSFHRFRK